MILACLGLCTRENVEEKSQLVFCQCIRTNSLDVQTQLRHRSFLFKEVKSQILAAYFSIGADHRSQSSIFARIRNRNEVTLPSFPASKIWPPSFVAMAGDNNDNFTHTYDPPIDLSLNQILNLHFNLLLNIFLKSSLNLPLSQPQNPSLALDWAVWG